MYHNILVPVLLDPAHAPDTALLAARAIAEDGARITLLHVVEELPAFATAYVALDMIEAARKEAATRLKEIANQHDGVGTALVSGHSARTILRWAEEDSVDCIIVSSHKPGVQDYFLGGTAGRVVRYSQCAVHVIR